MKNVADRPHGYDQPSSMMTEAECITRDGDEPNEHNRSLSDSSDTASVDSHDSNMSKSYVFPKSALETLGLPSSDCSFCSALSLTTLSDGGFKPCIWEHMDGMGEPISGALCEFGQFLRIHLRLPISPRDSYLRGLSRVPTWLYMQSMPSRLRGSTQVLSICSQIPSSVHGSTEARSIWSEYNRDNFALGVDVAAKAG